MFSPPPASSTPPPPDPATEEPSSLTARTPQDYLAVLAFNMLKAAMHQPNPAELRAYLDWMRGQGLEADRIYELARRRVMNPAAGAPPQAQVPAASDLSAAPSAPSGKQAPPPQNSASTPPR